MNLGWLKDFMAVAELGSFSRGADARAITQPAMSRHIKGLEDHIGFRLIDRDNFPATLTPAGKKFYGLAGDTLGDLEKGIVDIKRQLNLDNNVLSFSMQHVLAAEFFPRWWKQQDVTAEYRVRVDASNLHDCVQQLEIGQSDFLMCYHHPSINLELNPERFSGIKVGDDNLVPVTAMSENGLPLHSLDGNNNLTIACSGSEDFMGKVVDHILIRNNAVGRVNRVYEDSFSEGVRSQALIGMGLAWLPMMLVQQDVEQHRLQVVGGAEWQQSLEIFLYCRPDQLGAGANKIWSAISSKAKF